MCNRLSHMDKPWPFLKIWWTAEKDKVFEVQRIEAGVKGGNSGRFLVWCIDFMELHAVLVCFWSPLNIKKIYLYFKLQWKCVIIRPTKYWCVMLKMFIYFMFEQRSVNQGKLWPSGLHACKHRLHTEEWLHHRGLFEVQTLHHKTVWQFA